MWSRPEHGLITLKFTEEKKPKCPFSGLQMNSYFTKAQRCHQRRQGKKKKRRLVALMLKSAVVINTRLSKKKKKRWCTARTPSKTIIQKNPL